MSKVTVQIGLKSNTIFFKSVAFSFVGTDTILSIAKKVTITARCSRGVFFSARCSRLYRINSNASDRYSCIFKRLTALTFLNRNSANGAQDVSSTIVFDKHGYAALRVRTTKNASVCHALLNDTSKHHFLNFSVFATALGIIDSQVAGAESGLSKRLEKT